MALFKISKGKSTDLGIKNGTNKTTEGYAYFTPDDGKFYIDVATANTVELGTNRIVLNSFKADLSQSFTVNLDEQSSFWTLNIPGLHELKDGLIIHILISTRPNDLYNVLNINGLGNELVYYKYNEPLGDKIQIPAELTLIYREDLSSFNQIFKNYNNNKDIDYGKSGWIIDSSYSINKADLYYGNLAGNAATATQLYSTPNDQGVFLRGDNTWTNKIIGDLYARNFYGELKGNATTATQLYHTPNEQDKFLRGDNIWTDTLNGNLTINGDLIANEFFSIGNDNFGKIYMKQPEKIIITNLNYSTYFEEISNNESYPLQYNEENTYWNVLNTKDHHNLNLTYSWKVLTNFLLNIEIVINSESYWDYFTIKKNKKEIKKISGQNENNVLLFLKAGDIIDFTLKKDHSYNPEDEYYKMILLHWQEYPTIKINKNFTPENNNEQMLGTQENKWSKLYIGSKETYGSISQPIYWDNGIPTEITTLGIEYGGTNTTSFIENNLIIFKKDENEIFKLQSLEAESESKGKYLMSQGTDGPPTWNELSITLNGVPANSPSFYAPTESSDVGKFLQSNGANNAPIWVDNGIQLNGADSYSATASFYAPINAAEGPGYILHWDGTNEEPVWTNILSVDHGGTGVSSFSANSIIMSGNDATSALTTRAITNNDTNTAITTGINIPTMNTLYYGLVEVNDQSQSRETTIYAPTDSGWSGQFLKSNGYGVPSWVDLPIASDSTAGIITIGTSSTSAAAGNHTHDLTINNSSSITLSQGSTYILDAGGSTCTFTMPAAATVILNGNTTSSAEFYAPTEAGSNRQILRSNGPGGTPFWDSEYFYTLPCADEGTLGGIKIGYYSTDNNDKNYAVQLSETYYQAYVNVPWENTTNITINKITENTAYYLLGYTDNEESIPDVNTLYFRDDVYVSTTGSIHAVKVYNAVWNDYAEYRQTNNIQPGKVYQENDNGCMTVTNQRLIPGCSIASDTFGSAMGKTLDAQTPMAVAGRVLAYTYQNRSLYHAGMAVCSAPNGTVDIMTREEIIAYPDCIIGYVSEIPDYEEWGSGHVQVDGRIWIKVK